MVDLEERNGFTAEELWRDLKEYQDYEGHDYDYIHNYGYCYLDENYTFELPGYGTVETIEGQQMYKAVHGEAAGSYTEWDVYFIVKVDNRYFRFSGYDSSWDSPGIENVEEVEPVEKTVKVWERKVDY